MTSEPRVFRTRAQLLGGHYHVKVFSAKATNQTFANMGTVVMDKDDYRVFCVAFQGEHFFEVEEDFLPPSISNDMGIVQR